MHTKQGNAPRCTQDRKPRKGKAFEADCSAKGPKQNTVNLEGEGVCICLLCEMPQETHRIGNLEEGLALEFACSAKGPKMQTQ